MAKPGIMLYFEIIDPIRMLSDAERGQLLMAMLEYGKSGTLPAFDGTLALAWKFIQPKLDRDQEKYDLAVWRRQYATACRERKRNGEPEITFAEWMCINGHAHASMMINDDRQYPTAIKPATKNATTITKSTAPQTAAVAATSTDFDDYAAAAIEGNLKMMSGKLGKGVVALTDAQIEDLLEQIGLEMFDFYVDKLSNFILRNEARVKNHYDTILRWYREDSITGQKRIE